MKHPNTGAAVADDVEDAMVYDAVSPTGDEDIAGITEACEIAVVSSNSGSIGVSRPTSIHGDCLATTQRPVLSKGETREPKNLSRRNVSCDHGYVSRDYRGS